jgi:hypothetical protein
MSRACLILLAMLMLTPAAALADVIAMDQHVCRGKKAGDACSDPLKGVCERGECCRRRYGSDPSKLKPNLGSFDDNNQPSSGPETYQECSECLRCAVGKRRPAVKRSIAPPDMAPAAPDATPDLHAAEDMELPAPDLAAAPDLPPTPDLPAPAHDLSAPAPDMAAAPAASPKGGMCASAPWRSDAGAWSLLVGALLLVGISARRRA